MYINHCVYKPLDQRTQRQQPRDRYVTYFEDLYRISGKTLSAETFLLGDQYSYSDIIDAVLAEGLPFNEYRSVSDVVFSIQIEQQVQRRRRRYRAHIADVKYLCLEFALP